MPEGTCSIDGCESPVKRRGWCTRHYRRWLRHGDPLTYLRTKGPTGTLVEDGGGYLMTWHPGHPLADKVGYVRQHRLVMWEAHGPFDLSMHVHHINGDKHDNRIENLELLTPSEHARLHGGPPSYDRTGQRQRRRPKITRPKALTDDEWARVLASPSPTATRAYLLALALRRRRAER